MIRLVQLKHDVETYKNFWLKNNLQPIEQNDLLYVAMGDSAAQGIGASSPQKGYVGLVASALSQKTSKHVHTVNLSVTGARVHDLIEHQLPEFKKLPTNNDTIVTVEIGANDMGTFDADNFAKEIDEVFSQLPQQAVVADIPYFGGGRYRQHETDALKASEIIRTLAQKYHLSVAPLHAVTQERDSWLASAADLFHPNDRGYRNWFEAFRQVMGL